MYDSDIISDLAADFLTDEGIDAITCVPKDAAVSEFSVNFSPMDRAYDRICALAGNSWYVDPWKRVNYIIELGSTAPFNVTSTTANWRDLVVNVSRGNYRNKEFLLGCYTQISTTESFKGDGYTRTWTLSKPVQGVPLVKVDGYISTVGISGVSASTFGYYWNKGSNQISGNTTNAALASTDWITIQYPALYPIYQTYERTTQVRLRGTYELNNSGLYEMAETVPDGSFEDASAFARAKLVPFGDMVKQVTFETDKDGLEVGMQITIEPSNYPYIGPFFITSISAKDVDIRTMRYKVTATNKAGLGNWFEFYRSLLRDNTVRYTENFENLAVHEGYY